MVEQGSGGQHCVDHGIKTRVFEADLELTCLSDYSLSTHSPNKATALKAPMTKQTAWSRNQLMRLTITNNQHFATKRQLRVRTGI